MVEKISLSTEEYKELFEELISLRLENVKLKSDIKYLTNANNIYSKMIKEIK